MKREKIRISIKLKKIFEVTFAIRPEAFVAQATAALKMKTE